MGSKTQEQRDADAALEAAVVRCIGAYKALDGSTLVDYVFVAEGLTVDGEGEIDLEHYGIFMRHGNARTTVALGLLTKGRELLQFGERVDDSDGE